MAITDLIPWGRGRDLTTRRSENYNPVLTLHREMNRKRRPRPIRKDLEGRIATRWRHGLQIR